MARAVDRGRGGGPPVHGGPGEALAAAWTESTWTGRTRPWAAVHRGPRAGAGAGACAGAPAGGGGAMGAARSFGGGAAGHGGACRGHGRGRRDTTSAMASSPPRNDEVKEKLDGGGFDGGGASLARTVAARISKLGF
ncbi:glycine-rich cell wall structural protein-like [Sorghum bicolor]|uniref:glycine-rich cell wall structural protein-like n=1 Tax=Sorghum bicolor TaxID=4558 RepID=UPI000B424A3A|nr:glycine-rich cell wall structural protein-like [Sorghum bicolor]|eukprot:XP_021317784.1 glycine-rich cell wall structural protein-like [Sorghum bicolor]